jgi:hypothetical protein
MKYIIQLVFGFLLISSCSGNIFQTEPPEDLIPRDTFVCALKEIYILEGFFQNQFIQLNNNVEVIQRSGDQILKKYGLTHSRFKSSMDYYASEQTEMQSINNDLLDSLNKDLSALQLKN